MKKALMIEELKERIGKPVFVIDLIYGGKNWRVIEGFRLAGLNTIKFTDRNYIINFENTQFFRFFDTEVSETELKEILDAEEKEKKTGYERVEMEKDYYTITSTKDVTDMREHDVFNANNEKRYKNGNYFNDEKLTENIARAETLKYQLRRFAALNGGIPSQKDWQNWNCCKYSICYDYDENKIEVCDRSFYKDFGQIYFKDREACKKAMEIFKDELLWLFTEFEEMLY